MRHRVLGGALVAIAAIFSVTGPTWAHHGDAGRYNEEVTTVVGVVAQWRLINPHSVLILDVEDADGRLVRWRGELGNPTNLGTRAHGHSYPRRVGNDIFRPQTHVNVS